MSGKARKRPTRWTPEKEAGFLRLVAAGETITASARQAGFARQTVYEHREKSAAFKAHWADAIEQNTELLEKEAFRRAHEGIDHPVTYEGAITATYKEYSDTLLIFLLKARRPEVYRERVEQHMTHTGTVRVEFVHDWRHDAR